MDYTHVYCLSDISDGLGLYCGKGEIYQVVSIDEEEQLAVIECNEVDGLNEMQICLDDNDFAFFKWETKR